MRRPDGTSNPAIIVFIQPLKRLATIWSVPTGLLKNHPFSYVLVNQNAVGMTDHLASQFIGWINGCIGFENAVAWTI